jgi:hypothetical protein
MRTTHSPHLARQVSRNQATYETFSHGTSVRGAEGAAMKALVWLGLALVVAWGVLWLGIKMAVFAVHALLIIGVALIGWGLLRRDHAKPTA